MRIITYTIVLLLFLCGLGFGLLNSRPVLIDFMVVKYTLPLGFLVILSVLLGSLLTAVVCWLCKWGRRSH